MRFFQMSTIAAEAARAGVFIHGLAGDLASESVGERTMLTSDLIGHLSAAFNTLD
jgi:ADP-dependent NAD(P)H-hydrate dehydratase / NAD(P)H-hydrate epimerase